MTKMIYYIPTPMQINWLIETDKTIKGSGPNQSTGLLYSWLISTNKLAINDSRHDEWARKATPEQVRELIWHIFNVKRFYL